MQYPTNKQRWPAAAEEQTRHAPPHKYGRAPLGGTACRTRLTVQWRCACNVLGTARRLVLRVDQLATLLRPFERYPKRQPERHAASESRNVYRTVLPQAPARSLQSLQRRASRRASDKHGANQEVHVPTNSSHGRLTRPLMSPRCTAPHCTRGWRSGPELHAAPVDSPCMSNAAPLREIACAYDAKSRHGFAEHLLHSCLRVMCCCAHLSKR